MTGKALLDAEKAHLSKLLEAIERCVYFLDATTQKLPFPLLGETLEIKKKDLALFESLSSFNERFAKLQDTLASAMRHTYLLMGENSDHFLKILAFFEKHDIIKSIEIWQQLRTTRNLAAHDYETSYHQIADHFNTLHELVGQFYQISGNLIAFCHSELNIRPTSNDFSIECFEIVIKKNK
jgi:uncharacterized protein with HEPN domain